MGIISDWHKSIFATVMSIGITVTNPAAASLGRAAAQTPDLLPEDPAAMTMKQITWSACMFVPKDKQSMVESVKYTTKKFSVGQDFISEPGDLLVTFKGFDGMIGVRGDDKMVVLPIAKIMWMFADGDLLKLKAESSSLGISCSEAQLLNASKLLATEPKPVQKMPTHTKPHAKSSDL